MGIPCDTTAVKPVIKLLPTFVKRSLMNLCNDIGDPLLDFRYGYMQWGCINLIFDASP